MADSHRSGDTLNAQPRRRISSLQPQSLAAAPRNALAQSPRSAHPDFSGLWFPGGGRSQTPQQLPYTPAAKKLATEYENHFTLDDDPGRFCIWPGMPRAVWGAPFTVEIQQRPQDVTIYWEGYGMYRKIYMADHNPPKPMLPSAMGHSLRTGRATRSSSKRRIQAVSVHDANGHLVRRACRRASAPRRARREGEKQKFLVNDSW